VGQKGKRERRWGKKERERESGAKGKGKGREGFY